jgi:predicted ribosome quality control (RQC) complex YloA/Tae2 family protein
VYYDALTTAAIADECRRTLCGGRVQQVLQVDELSVGLEIYAAHKRHYLLASAHSRHSRVHLTQTKLRRGVETPVPLILLLRKYVRGGRVAAVRHPPFERILHLEVESAEGRFALIAEVMGRHSNIILCDPDGTVMDAIKRVGPHLSRVRPILPGNIYTPPPPQRKLDPTDVSERRLCQVLEEVGEGRPVWRALVNGIRGVSPLLGREVAYRALGDDEVAVREVSQVTSLLDAFQGLMRHVWEHDWQPCIALEEGRAVAFAPYQVTHYEDLEQACTTSEAIDRYYGALVGVDAYAPAKARVRESLREACRRATSKRLALEREMVPQSELSRLRRSGEMILAYAHAVRPGQQTLEAQADLDGPPMQIQLDPQMTAVENAQAYFRRYEKAKAASADLPELLARADLELAYLEQLSTDLDLASNWPEIDEVREALVSAGYLHRKRRSQIQHGQPLRVTSEDGMLILVGRSARQNHQVTFRQASPQDLWLHAVDVPGGHVIVKSGGQPVPERTLQQAAALAAGYSAARGEGDVLVAYTERRYVRPIRGAGPGLVTYTHEQTIGIAPAREAPAPR